MQTTLEFQRDGGRNRCHNEAQGLFSSSCWFLKANCSHTTNKYTTAQNLSISFPLLISVQHETRRQGSITVQSRNSLTNYKSSFSWKYCYAPLKTYITKTANAKFSDSSFAIKRSYGKDSWVEHNIKRIFIYIIPGSKWHIHTKNMFNQYHIVSYIRWK